MHITQKQQVIIKQLQAEVAQLQSKLQDSHKHYIVNEKEALRYDLQWYKRWTYIQLAILAVIALPNTANLVSKAVQLLNNWW